ncbi:MAG TPA: outer membrane protein assembly factor BamB [Casimicrobiaceae bacterium]|nr:outer membrane protein assembly factor BamB [Casimicrobiaceae bacterium]
MRRRRRCAVWLAAFSATWLAGCSTLSTWLPSWLTEPPSLPSWLRFGKDPHKPGPLPEFTAKANARVNWQVAVGGKASVGFAPAERSDVVYAAASDGALVAVDPATGAQLWRVNAGKPLSAGVGADATEIVVGTDKGDVLAFDPGGKPLWQTKVSSEVNGPPRVADGIVVVWSLDGKIYALAQADGARKWVYQRATPPLTVRRFAGGVVSRGGLFTGTPGGKLLGIDLATGALAWEANVTTPKGATELERIADITSLPVVADREVCAAAYLGRVACFDAQRGTLAWSRDFGSLYGITVDNRYLYLTDDKGAIQALDKSTGASVWKQDKLAQRFPGGPVVVGDYLGVVDAEGYLHLLDRNDGALVGRLATDGKPPASQPIAVADSAIWQTVAGNLISASAR